MDGKLYQTFSHSHPARGARVGDFVHSLERATSLQPGDWTASPQEVLLGSVAPEPSDLETVTVRTTHPIAETSKEYFRLKVVPTGQRRPGEPGERGATGAPDDYSGIFTH